MSTRPPRPLVGTHVGTPSDQALIAAMRVLLEWLRQKRAQEEAAKSAATP